jgi:magnesium-transporting ATPase (P-type)
MGDRSSEEIEVVIKPSVGTVGTPQYQAVDRVERPPMLGINARRSGSASILVTNERGELVVERKVSDLKIAVKNRLSSSALPSVLNIGAQEPQQAAAPVSAVEVLEKKGGKGAAGAYSEHMYPLETLAEKFETHIDVNDPTKSRGLTEDKAKAVLAIDGPNVLVPPHRIPLWMLFLLQFTSLLMVLLEITSLLCIILFLVDMSNYTNLYLGVLLAIVVLVTCYETYSQEAKADSLMEQFRAMVPAQASVIRDGVMYPIEVSQLVAGDIIRLKSGDKVPADCRVIYNESQKV